nr:unnamed protein product [Callosobruchus chinensis]
MTDLGDLNENNHSGNSNLSLNDGSDVCPPSLSTKQLELALNKEITEEELVEAITHCKELVLDSEQLSIERKWLVRHLIELRLHLQEYREAMNDSEHPRNKVHSTSKRTIKGHHLILQPMLHSPTTGYCDHCTGAIWSVVQTWYECEDCGYSCHYKCLSSIMRECAHVVATEKGTYEFDICPEDGLSAQQYQCAECKASLPLTVPKRISCLGRVIFQGNHKHCSLIKFM